MEQRCPRCASARLTAIRNTSFAIEWRCLACVSDFVEAVVSVVMVDPVERRRQDLVSCLTGEGIPVIAASQFPQTDGWAVGKVLVVSASSVPQVDTGAAHVIVLADSNVKSLQVPALADDRTTTTVQGEPMAVLAALRNIAASQLAIRVLNGPGDRRHGPRDRRKFTRRDRRS